MITTIERFRELVPTVTGKSLTKYTQPINDACGWFSRQIVGAALMRVIEPMQSEGEAPELFQLAQRVVAYKAYLIAIPKMDVIETDNGFAVVNDETFAPASKERVNALVASMVESLDMALGSLIEYLEDSSEHREEWRKSPVYLSTAESYITTLRMFKQYGAFSGGYLDFIGARATLHALIVKHIEPAISPEFSNAVLEQIQTEKIEEKNLTIVEKLRMAQAGYYNQDHLLGDSCVAHVRETLESSPDEFPAFKDSTLYKKILQGRESHLQTTSIHVMI